MQVKGDGGRRPNGGVVEESQNMNWLRIDRRKRCTIGLVLAEDMIVAGIVRNALRRASQHDPPPRSWGVGIRRWKGVGYSVLLARHLTDF